MENKKKCLSLFFKKKTNKTMKYYYVVATNMTTYNYNKEQMYTYKISIKPKNLLCVLKSSEIEKKNTNDHLLCGVPKHEFIQLFFLTFFSSYSP